MLAPPTVKPSAKRAGASLKPDGPVAPHVAAAIDGARGGGALPPQVRDRMEDIFGAGFGSVRVHENAQSRALSSRLGARAFTVGDDIFFGPGASAGDRGLLAHELTHVVQQRAMPSRRVLTFGAPDDGHERQAARVGSRVAGGAATTGEGRLLPAPQSVASARRSGSVVQRYQAGEYGHGGMEERALQRAGFKGDRGSGEVGAVYLGNWLRDWSQVSQADPALNAVVYGLLNILSWGEFSRPLDPAKLGGYVPSEHLDNPLGGKTVEDYPSGTKDFPQTKAFKESYATLSATQKAAYLQQLKTRGALEAASVQSGLPVYIERGKSHIRAKLAQAVRMGKTRDAMLELGDALHGIEDYFAHSNFVELALFALTKHGDDPKAKTAAAGILAKAKSTAGGGFDATSIANVGADTLKRGAAIVTGTYGDESGDANKTASLLEQLHSEILTGQLRRAFILGLPRAKSGVLTVPAGTFIGRVAGTIGGGVSGYVSGLWKGVGNTMSSIGSQFEQWAANPLNPPAGEVTSDIFGTASRSMHAQAESAGESGEAAGRRAGEITGGALGTAQVALKPGPLILNELSVQIGKLLNPFIEPLIAKKAAAATKASTIGAPRKPESTGKAPPTHSELAKDARSHPVFPASQALAEKALEAVAHEVLLAWSASDKDIAVAHVLQFADKYVAYPAYDPKVWWKTPLEDFLTGKH